MTVATPTPLSLPILNLFRHKFCGLFFSHRGNIIQKARLWKFPTHLRNKIWVSSLKEKRNPLAQSSKKSWSGVWSLKTNYYAYLFKRLNPSIGTLTIRPLVQSKSPSWPFKGTNHHMHKTTLCAPQGQLQKLIRTEIMPPSLHCN